MNSLIRTSASVLESRLERLASGRYRRRRSRREISGDNSPKGNTPRGNAPKKAA
jgi:hypothetical protein